MKTNILNLTMEELQEHLKNNFSSSKVYHAKELFRWIYRKHEFDFNSMTNISKRLREEFSKHLSVEESMLEKVETDSTDHTKKLLIKLNDDEHIESVIIPTEKRITLCMSSQVGCAMNCDFCFTGTLGFKRNLKVSEIVDQLRFADKIARADTQEDLAEDEHPISNIVFMGMGEPLLNLEAVGKAIQIMEEQLAFGYSKRRITVSTCGIVDKLLELPKWGDSNLAVSLNAVNDELRNKLMPINKKYPLKILFDTLEKYPLERGRRITFEYVLLKGLNDSDNDAGELIKLMKRLPSKVNLICFNTYHGTDYASTKKDRALEFQKIMMDAGVQTNLRESRGQEISAACGQLVGKSGK